MRQRFKTILLVCGLTVLTPVAAQIPSTDIFVMDVVSNGKQDGVTNVRRLTDREGYDNQPKFLPDGKAIVYSSWRENGTDIYRLSLADGSSAVIAASPEGEYSPTPIPGA